MYKCKKCGNTKYFFEHHNIKTYVVVDDETGQILHTEDRYLSCAEVCCDKCKASTENGDILDINGKIVTVNY